MSVEMLKSFKLTPQHVKLIGRTHMHNGTRWLALSGSGIEFSFYGKKAEITIVGDQIATSGINEARIAIEVNGQRVVDEIVTEKMKTYSIFANAVNEIVALNEVRQENLFEDIPEEMSEGGSEDREVTVRIIKLSEAAMSTVGITDIKVDGVDGIKATPARARKIEFIGDSITCGYGVDASHAESPFTTGTEDVTKAYAYVTAQKLDADYSMVSYSGYGIISGYTENDQKLTTHILPHYYNKFAKSEGLLNETVNPLTIAWNFNEFTPDLIVINLGTNDDSYTKDHPERQGEYEQHYGLFLKQVRANNPHAKILCTLGIMGDRLFPYVERAVATYSNETGDTNIATMKFEVQLPEDGFGADWHPSTTTHRKAANKLTSHVQNLMGWD
jgi:lysophospholipase L1-like esterase